MPKITSVKAAQQRYATKPVLDAAGQPVRVVRLTTTRSGRQVSVAKTERDLSQPLEPYVCDFCHQPIAVGQGYKWMQPKTGPNGGVRRNRHDFHPDWMPWEYSSSLSARIAQITHNGEVSADSAETLDDFQTVATDAAEEIRSLASEKQEAADNIESGFGHETSQSAELRETAQALEEWADQFENIDWPDEPDEVEEPEKGTPLHEDDEEYDAALEEYETYVDAKDEFQNTARSEITDLLNSAPV
jgi:hypothetical protein